VERFCAINIKYHTRENEKMIENLLKLSGYTVLAKEAADFLLNSKSYRKKEQNRALANSISASLIGLAVGVGVGLLFAPRAGRETREIISETTQNQIDRLQSELAERKKQINEVIKTKKDELYSASPGATEKAEA
jgi:F0F1-type ATP synthase assembly protein I